MDAGGEIGLRERKKRRTRETIARVALELFDRQGYDETTIPEIAAAADVSPRTVSGYFPHKEQLAFPHDDEWFAELEARLRERPAGETAPEALRAWVESRMPDWQRRDAERLIQHRVIAANESLQAYKGRYLARTQELMTEAIARDLGAAPDDIEPRMAAAATTAILDVLGAHKGEREPSGEELAEWHAEALTLLDQAVRFVAAGIEALRETPRDAGETPARSA